MKRVLLLTGVLVVVLAGWMFLRNREDVGMSGPTPTVSPTPDSTNSPHMTPLVSLELKTDLSSKNLVTYTDSGYTPNVLKIKKGDTVTWKNQSSRRMWTASDPHPIHTEYPENGGCINGAFDECKGDPSGAEWSFTFTHTGTWNYHNHVNSRDEGTIIVE